VSRGSGLGRWIGGHKWLTAFIVVVVLGWATTAGADEPDRGRPVAGEPSSDSRDDSSEETDETSEPAPEAEPATSSGAAQRHRRAGEGRGRGEARGGEKAPPKPEPTPRPTPTPRTYLVTRVIDGDTLELASGRDVRLVGIDTPEVGECGYEKAAANLSYLTLGQQVSLAVSDEDQDRYGRLLRYVRRGRRWTAAGQERPGNRSLRLPGRLRLPPARAGLHRRGQHHLRHQLPEAAAGGLPDCSRRVCPGLLTLCPAVPARRRLPRRRRPHPSHRLRSSRPRRRR